MSNEPPADNVPVILRPAYVSHIVREYTLHRSTAAQAVEIRARPCFAWLYHDLDASGRPRPFVTCPRDGEREERCPVRGLCREATEVGRVYALRLRSEGKRWQERQVAVDLTPATETLTVRHAPEKRRSPRESKVGQVEALARVLRAALGPAPASTTTQLGGGARSRIDRTMRLLGPVFWHAGREYGDVFAWQAIGEGGAYVRYARAHLRTARALLVDVRAEVTVELQRVGWEVFILPPSLRTKWPTGAHGRVTLSTDLAAESLAAVLLRVMGYDREQVAAWGRAAAL